MLYADREGEEKAKEEVERQQRKDLRNGLAILAISLVLFVVLIDLLIRGRPGSWIVATVFLIVLYLAVGDLISWKRPQTYIRVRVYEDCIMFPTRKSVLFPYRAITISLGDIKDVHPNRNEHLDYVTLVSQDRKRIAVNKSFIVNLVAFERALEGRVRVVRDLDMRSRLQ
ncbi:MAG: hypothetical protein V3U09_07165 [Thermoplasmata archaeon]